MKAAVLIGLFSIYVGVKFAVLDIHLCIQKIIPDFEILFSNLMESCFVFNTSKLE